MYKENKPDSEDFLLGKRIDTLGKEEETKTEGKYNYLHVITPKIFTIWSGMVGTRQLCRRSQI